MDDKGEALVLDDQTSSLVLTVETVYLFPVSSEQSGVSQNDDSPSSGEGYETPNEEPIGAEEAQLVLTGGAECKAELECVDAGMQDEDEPVCGKIKDSDIAAKSEAQKGQSETLNVSVHTHGETNESDAAAPSHVATETWNGPRPWLVNGRARYGIVPKKDSVIGSEAVALRSSSATSSLRTNRNRERVSKVRSVPQGPTIRYPWTSVRRERSSSLGNTPDKYVEEPLPTSNLECDTNSKGKNDSHTSNILQIMGDKLEEVAIHQQGHAQTELRGQKRPLSRLFPKSAEKHKQSRKGPSDENKIHSPNCKKQDIQGQYVKCSLVEFDCPLPPQKTLCEYFQ